MNILIVGCGKVGSMLAGQLSHMGHDVSVLDPDEESFELLDSDFSGYTVCGVPIDQQTLKRAGVEGCDAILAMTEDDNVNIMVCQIAQEIFHAKTVLARIFDPRREAIFSSFGIRTISPTNLTVDAVLSSLSGPFQRKQLSFNNTTLSFGAIPLRKGWVGRHAASLGLNKTHVFGVQHPDGSITLLDKNPYLIKEGDLLLTAQIID